MKNLISIRLDEGLIQEIDRKSKRDNRSRSNTIETILQDYFVDYTSIDTLIDRINECKTLGELEHVEDLFIKDKYTGMTKVDLEIACTKKYQELRG